MATVVTPNLRLNVPEFDQVPWDVDVNTNWLVLDATVGMFTAIPNLTGVWKNNTDYMFGQSAIDPSDSSIWQCVQAHKSTVAPTTFEQERILYPARWTITTPGAQFYAEQAAASAQAAAESAADAAESAAEVGGGALLKSGGTMTGSLILFHDPAVALEATTKQYVDARVGGAGFLPLTGGTLTGVLTVPSIVYTGAVSGAHSFAFQWNGAVVSVVVDNVFIGNMATQTYVAGSFLPISGGSITGNLYVAGTLSTANLLSFSTGAQLYTDGSYTYINWDSSNWKLAYTRSNGSLTYQQGGTNTPLWSVDGAGNTSVAGQFVAASYILASGNLYARNGNLYIGAGDRTHLYSDNASYTRFGMLDNYGWFLNWSNGSLAWQRYDGSNMVVLDNSGNINALGEVHGGTAVSTSGGFYGYNTQLILANGGNGRILQFQGNWYWNWNSANGDLVWIANGSDYMHINQGDGVVYDYRGPFAGNGAYYNFSDERMKSDIEPITYGLDTIRKLRPISFKRTQDIPGKDRTEIGFSAQQVQEFIPEAVRDMHMSRVVDDKVEDDEPMLGMSIDPIVAALVVGMQQMADRIEQLEADRGTTTH